MADPGWKDRRAGLEAYITALIARVNASGVPRSTTIEMSLQALLLFAQSHIGYFEQGFLQVKFEPIPKYPMDFVLRRIVERFAEDLEALDRCYQDRLSNPAGLDLADKLAAAALKPAKDLALILPETRVLTYFSKVPNIRLVPYAPVALVGIPRSATPRDLLAIPHEVAHYVYWNPPSRTQLKGAAVSDRLTTALQARSAPLWAQTWQEEIFCDVYGALVGRGVFAQSFQDLSVETSDQQFIEDDGEHPTPVFRPEIFTMLFRKIPALVSAVLTNGLEGRWTGKVTGRSATVPLAGGQVAYLVVKTPDPAGSLPVILTADIRTEVQKVVDEAFNILNAALAAFNAGANTFPREPDLFGIIDDPLYDQFLQARLNAFAAGIPSATLDSGVFSTVGWDSWRNAYGIPLLADLLNPAHVPLPAAEWAAFFVLTYGWTTEGPTGRPTEFP